MHDRQKKLKPQNQLYRLRGVSRLRLAGRAPSAKGSTTRPRSSKNNQQASHVEAFDVFVSDSFSYGSVGSPSLQWKVRSRRRSSKLLQVSQHQVASQAIPSRFQNRGLLMLLLGGSSSFHNINAKIKTDHSTVVVGGLCSLSERTGLEPPFLDTHRDECPRHFARGSRHVRYPHEFWPRRLLHGLAARCRALPHSTAF